MQNKEATAFLFCHTHFRPIVYMPIDFDRELQRPTIIEKINASSKIVLQPTWTLVEVLLCEWHALLSSPVDVPVDRRGT